MSIKRYEKEQVLAVGVVVEKLLEYTIVRFNATLTQSISSVTQRESGLCGRVIFPEGSTFSL